MRYKPMLRVVLVVFVFCSLQAFAAGLFFLGVDYAVSGPEAAAVGDFNDDGIPDLAVASADPAHGVVILIGNGDGTFQPGIGYNGGGAGVAVAVADLNGDKELDIAVANRAAGKISVLLGNGDGTFQAPTSYAVGPAPVAVAASDLNHDGEVDLILANLHGGNSDGSVTVLLGIGDGKFGAVTHYAAGREPTAMALADFNGDGFPDAIVSNLIDGTVSVLIGSGDGTFQRPVRSLIGPSPQFIATGDFNGDNKFDVASTIGGKVSVALGRGDGTFQSPLKYPIQSPAGIAVGDFDHDGSTDLAMAIASDFRVSVLQGNGNGTFGRLSTYRTNGGDWTVLATDLNGDGYLDLVVTAPLENVISVLMSTGP